MINVGLETSRILIEQIKRSHKNGEDGKSAQEHSLHETIQIPIGHEIAEEPVDHALKIHW